MISILIPVYNESPNIAPMCARIREVSLTWELPFELIFVNDASTDDTADLIKAEIDQDARISLIQLSRNFGHQAAISAGIKHSKGDGVVLMDGDMQDPPEVISTFIQKWKEGNQVVYGIRTKRKEPFFLRLSYSVFYRLLSRIGDIDIPIDSGDFCLMDRKVVNVIVHQMPEQIRFIRGLRAYSGFKQIGVEFERAERLNGEPKYTQRKLARLAADGLFGFSTFPLRLASYIGLIVSIGSFMVGVFFIVHRIVDFKLFGYSPADVPGLASLAVGLFFLFGITLMILGIIGEYIGRIYMEVKKRPQYVIGEIVTQSSLASEN